MAQQRLPDLPPPPPEGVADSMAATEATGFANADLESLTRAADHRRSELAKTHVVNCALGLFWVMAFLFGTGTLILAWHILAPPRVCWLDADQLGVLKGLVGGVILSSGVQALGRKYLA